MKEKIKKILKIMLKKNIKLFLRKYFLFLIPLFLLILYFLYPFFVAIPESLSQARAEKCFENCVADKWLNEELNYLEAVNYCKVKCDYRSNRYYYGDKMEVKHSLFVNLFLENLDRNSTPYYQKIFRFQNIIIILLGLILYYGIIFGINITKRLEKQK
ncbi:hypothetical protein KKE19_02495 [Patescibacteria group bacterium]|nr:hypothetical protein [Patescibacteria group bacterium]MBU4367705.1 hypothetical protein [Patescibacteria group bacterium]MBU4461845.1 hypothetical protein [Patescibacteria group bacterium]MCG2700024.1 hypothetical protein [Candidatus Parcubacteria bacterium]